jgi:hypothetical protein
LSVLSSLIADQFKSITSVGGHTNSTR